MIIKLLWILAMAAIGLFVGLVVSHVYFAAMERTGAVITAKSIVEVKFGIPAAFVVIGAWIGYGMATKVDE